MKLLYQLHKWLAVAAAAATMAWFVSGVLMVIPPGYRTLTPGVPTDLSNASLPGSPQFEDATVSVASAVDAVRQQQRKPVRVVSIRLRRLPGRLAYEVTTAGAGTHLVDAQRGGVFTVDERLAAAIAAAALGTKRELGPGVPQTRQNASCAPRFVPGYLFALDDGKGTTFCVGATLGDYEHSDRLMRATEAISEWHEFRPLQSWVSSGVNRLLLFGFAVIGTVMSAFGVIILGVQLQRWWKRTRGRAQAEVRSV